MAEILNGRGLAAANLTGGMVGWGLGTSTHPIAAAAARRASGRCSASAGAASRTWWRDGTTPSWWTRTGGSTSTAALLEREGLRLRAVFDTHLHADHVSGGPALARDAGVAYHASPRDFEGATVRVEALVDGRPVRVGRLELLPIVPIGTPGHTPGSTSLLVAGALLLTGDTLFVDDVGRPDLGGQAAAWARDLHRTLHERLGPLADPVVVLPAHASGLAATGPDGAVTGTLGDLRRRNPAMRLDLDAFVREAERAAGAAPPEYARIRAINLGRDDRRRGRADRARARQEPVRAFQEVTHG